MRHLHTYLFIISLVTYSSIIGQEANTAARDTLPPSEKYGLRIGVDISRLLRTALSTSGDENKDEYTGFELVGDYRFYKDFYIAAELGNESLSRKEANINVVGSGSYARVGFDYNTYKNWYGMQNSIFVGLRYGFSTFNQTLNSYRVFTGTTYFPNDPIIDNRENKSLTASWGEFILGLKVELLKNIYLGASVSLRRLITEKSPETYDNLFIPGFGRKNDFSKFGIGYNYTISYLIPFVKKKR